MIDYELDWVFMVIDYTSSGWYGTKRQGSICFPNPLSVLFFLRTVFDLSWSPLVCPSGGNMYFTEKLETFRWNLPQFPEFIPITDVVMHFH